MTSSRAIRVVPRQPAADALDSLARKGTGPDVIGCHGRRSPTADPRATGVPLRLHQFLVLAPSIVPRCPAEMPVPTWPLARCLLAAPIVPLRVPTLCPAVLHARRLDRAPIVSSVCPLPHARSRTLARHSSPIADSIVPRPFPLCDHSHALAHRRSRGLIVDFNAPRSCHWCATLPHALKRCYLRSLGAFTCSTLCPAAI